MIADMAEQFGVSKPAVQGWMRQDTFPRPVARLKAGKVYDLDAVFQWRKRRLHERRAELDRLEGAL
jgi:predicted DNA-binding transcriptional regulator AlpA